MRLIFLGTPEFAVPSLRALHASSHEVLLVVAQPDRPAGRGMKMQKPAVAEAAIELGLPLVQPPKLDATFLDEVRELRPDVGIVVAYGKILRKALLDIPPRGFLNVHGSILPRWRGAAPVQRAIEAGDRESGVAIMQLDEDLDHGPVFDVARLAIGDDELAPSLFARLAESGARLLVEVLDRIERGDITPQEQDHSAATHAKKIEKEEGLVDWSQPARRIYDRFRAFQPWPGLTAMIGGEAIKLTDVAMSSEMHGVPGEVVSIDRDGIVVQCGGSALRIRQMQRPGKRSLPAVDVARGLGLEQGAILA